MGEQENIALQNIKSTIGEATDAGAIKYIIRNYAELKDRYECEIKKNNKLTAENAEMNQKIKRFRSAFSDLIDIK